MDDFKLKIILSILSGIVFSFIFIILAFVMPAEKKEYQPITKAKNRLESISQSMKK